VVFMPLPASWRGFRTVPAAVRASARARQTVFPDLAEGRNGAIFAQSGPARRRQWPGAPGRDDGSHSRAKNARLSPAAIPQRLDESSVARDFRTGKPRRIRCRPFVYTIRRGPRRRVRLRAACWLAANFFFLSFYPAPRAIPLAAKPCRTDPELPYCHGPAVPADR